MTLDSNNITGYPSIDKPWLKYYSQENIQTELPKCTMYDQLREENVNRTDTIALRYFGRKITFSELFKNIESTAKAFAAEGIKKGDVVIVSSVTLPEIVYSIYALNMIGAIPNMVDPRTSEEGIRKYIQEVSAHVFITIDVAYPKIVKSAINTSIKKVVKVSAINSMPFPLKKLLEIKDLLSKKAAVVDFPSCDWNEFIRNGRNCDYTKSEYKPRTCALIVHTGGTTGMPKSVMLSNDNATAAFHEAFQSPIPMRSGDVFLNLMPPFIAYGVILGLHTALCWGWQSVIIPKFDPNEFDKLIVKYKPQGLIGVPSYFEKLMSSRLMRDTDLSFVKCVLAGGDKTKPEFEERINQFLESHGANIHLTKGYSMTEASAMATVSFENTPGLGSNGVPLVKTIIAAFEEGTDRELPYGELGELCLCTPTMMMGYYNDPVSTDEILKTHSDGKRWIHSGDLGYVDENGLIYTEGRIKRLIIRGDGYKVFPPFVEKVIMNHQAIENCCVVAVRDTAHEQGCLPLAFCVLKPDVGLSKQELIEELKVTCINELPEYSQPVGFRFLAELPLTPIGKVDYLALEKMASAKS